MNDFNLFRRQWTAFHFDACDLTKNEREWQFVFHYRMTGPSGEERFTHQVVLKRNQDCTREPSEKLIRHAAMQLGLVETINYWKLACPEQLIVHPFALTPEQVSFWKKLFIKGLGEFFYMNGIYGQIAEEELVQISSAADAQECQLEAVDVSGVLIPVGGGKDSVVTLELLDVLKEESHVFLLSARRASYDTAEAAGFPADKQVIMTRHFDPRMLDMNRLGYLNGHIPYSAVLAFSCVLAAIVTGKKSIVLSNEGSANEPTVPDTYINHQYSKSMEFEEDFSDYLHKFVTPDIDYFSLLRPWSEARISMAFARMKKYHRLFLSCNQGSKENRWCCQCPKCLFVFIILGAFAGLEETTAIFGENLLEKQSLQETLEELLGIAPNKPFECVGTVAETAWCMRRIAQRTEGEAPKLVRFFRTIMPMMEEIPMRMTEPEMAYLIPEKFKPFVLLPCEEDSCGT